MIGRLLQEVSWSSGAGLRRYRDGGCGLENVPTSEVIQALDFLPRELFLGAVLGAAHGATTARGVAIREIEAAEVSILDETQLNPRATDRGKQLIVQPDCLIRSAGSYTLVEVKGLRANSFGERQLAKEYATALAEARGRSALILLVLREPPPISVQKQGRLPLEEAVALKLAEVIAGAPDHSFDHRGMIERIPEVFAWITWAELAHIVDGAAADFVTSDPSIAGMVRRLARSIAVSTQVHS
ncbi:MAG: hypothetical protein ACR2JU_13670 [Nocardioidaceae bacterium]